MVPPPKHSTSTLPNNIVFGQVIEEALPYADMEHESYPPLSELTVENLVATAKATTKDIHPAPSLLDLISSRQRGCLVTQPVAALLQNCAEEGVSVHIGQPWPIQAL